MKFILDRVSNNDKLVAHFEPEQSEEELYTDIISTIDLIDTISGLGLSSDKSKIVLFELTEAACSNILSLFKRNFEVEMSFSLSASLVKKAGSDAKLSQLAERLREVCMRM